MTSKTSCCQLLSSFTNVILLEMHKQIPLHLLCNRMASENSDTKHQQPQRKKPSARLYTTWQKWGTCCLWCELSSPFIGKGSRGPNSCSTQINIHTVHDSSPLNWISNCNFHTDLKSTWQLWAPNGCSKWPQWIKWYIWQMKGNWQSPFFNWSMRSHHYFATHKGTP